MSKRASISALFVPSTGLALNETASLSRIASLLLTTTAENYNTHLILDVIDAVIAGLLRYIRSRR